MKLFINILLIGIVAIGFVSCGLPYCKKTHLSENELEWIASYHVNDTLLLHDQQSTDTMIITAIQVSNKQHISIFDLKSCNWLEGQNEYKANASVDFKLKHKDTWWEGLFFIEKRFNDSNIVAMLTLGGLYSKDISISPKEKKITVVEGANAENGVNQKLMGVRSFIWEKKRGLMSITLKDGSMMVRETLENK